MKKASTTLIILDGFGLSEQAEGNAILAAKTPVLERLSAEYAHTTLAASGSDVGLEPGQPGNSATGRANIEAGRIVPQLLPRINHAIETGSFFENKAYCAAMDACLEKGSALHLIGLLSDGGVHSSIRHLFALLKMASIKGLPRVYIHGILDGQDTPPRSGRGFVEQARKKCDEFGVGKIATLMGRRYAMDRGDNWERVEQAYDALVYGEGLQIDDPVLAVGESYRDGIPDEDMEPVICDHNGMISDNDSVIFFNFRADRARALTRAFVDPAFNGFKREHFPLTFVCTSDYGVSTDNALVAFPQQPLKNTLGAFLEEMGVTGVRTADTARCIDLILSGEYDVIVFSLDDCSVAGHAGKFEEAVRAVERVDTNVGKVVDATLQMGGIAIVTAGHGNVEQMLDPDGKASPMNTVNRVPFILCGAGSELREGRLADVSPTILDLLGLAQPPEMDGKTLILR